MDIAYRLSDDLELLTDMRLAYILHDHPGMAEAERLAMRTATHEFIGSARAEGRYLGFVGLLDGPGGEAACSAGLLVYDLPPIDAPSPRRVGHVLNFFTLPGFRRRGYGRGLMEFMIKTAGERGFDRLVLNATPDGYPLYLACGFGESEYKALRLVLRKG